LTIETYNCSGIEPQLIMKYIRVFLISLLLLPQLIFAQAWEAGIMLGGAGYYGDVNNEFFIQPRQLRGGILGFGRYHISDRLAVRANIAYMRVVGIDSLSSSRWQVARNMNFYSDIYEGSLQMELNLLPDRAKGKRIVNRIIPYLFGGVGLFHFTPKTFYQGREFNLAELNTSGINYSQIAITAPVGVGIRTYLTPSVILGVEGGLRFTSTSFLDDINGTQSRYPNPATLSSTDARIAYDRSVRNNNRRPDEIGWGFPGRQRGKIDGNDLYYFMGVSISYKWGSVTSRRFQGKVVRCPRFY
jgi:hypothetical protein